MCHIFALLIRFRLQRYGDFAATQLQSNIIKNLRIREFLLALPNGSINQGLPSFSNSQILDNNIYL